MKISVAMASYEGKKYIAEQIESILKNLKEKDELVISDDGSKDGTREVIGSFKDERIKLVEGPKKGIKQNFGNAIAHCSGDVIFLADQDDIWKSNKVAEVMKVFEDKEVACVVHDCEVFDSESGEVIYPSFFEWRGSKAGKLKNIWKNSYIGCCMAFRAEMKKYILPIPDELEMHDQWIGILAEKHGKSVFLPKVLLRYRRHGGNNSEMKRHGLVKMIRNRVVLMMKLKGR